MDYPDRFPILGEEESSLKDVYRTTVYLTWENDVEQIFQVRVGVMSMMVLMS